MSRDRLQVAISVEPAAEPVLAVLKRLHLDIGSVDARKLRFDAPAGARLLCVNLIDDDAVARLGAELRRELAGQPKALALTDRCFIFPLPLDTCLLVFLDIVALDLGL
jgi:hypothetical protein